MGRETTRSADRAVAGSVGRRGRVVPVVCMARGGFGVNPSPADAARDIGGNRTTREGMVADELQRMTDEAERALSFARQGSNTEQVARIDAQLVLFAAH